MKDYKKTAIKLFEKHDFAASMKYFSLAYENEKDAEILLMIDLCGLAEIDVLEALMFYGFFEIKKLSIVQYQQILDSIFEKIASHGSNFEIPKDAISYDDFMKLVEKNGNFKDVFESIMFSTKIVVSNKGDMLNFLKKLFENDYVEIGLAYMENFAKIYIGDKNFEAIAKKFIKNI